MKPRPFYTYILKVSSRCNINCSYCFVYNQADQQWRKQPAFMATSTARQVAGRILQHCRNHGQQKVHLVFHGGEPLLLGADRLRHLAQALREPLAAGGVAARFGLQTNGLLFDREIGDACREYGIGMGVSCDGPAFANDRSRVDHFGRGSSGPLEAPLKLLTTDYRDLFRGFLSVVDLRNEPRQVIDYLLEFEPPTIDFLLPYDNWDRPPLRGLSADMAEYGAWLCDAFDYWADSPKRFRVREFESYIRLLMGRTSILESTGLDPVDLIVVETNGEIEGVDSLKAVYDGATVLGLNVWEHSFEEALTHTAVTARQSGADSLCLACRQCPIVSVCGGGYLPNRYSREHRFQNPSVYCPDLKKLISHIGERVGARVGHVHQRAAI